MKPSDMAFLVILVALVVMTLLGVAHRQDQQLQELVRIRKAVETAWPSNEVYEELEKKAQP